jgi:hypothetical protein
MNGTSSGGQLPPGDGGGPTNGWRERRTHAVERLNALIKWQYVLVGAAFFLIGIAVLTDTSVS